MTIVFICDTHVRAPLSFQKGKFLGVCEGKCLLVCSLATAKVTANGFSNPGVALMDGDQEVSNVIYRTSSGTVMAVVSMIWRAC